MRGLKSPGVAQASRRHHRTWTLSALPVGRRRATGPPVRRLAIECIAAVCSDDLNATAGPRGAAIRSRIAFAPAIVTTSARKGWSPGATTQAEVCAMPTSVPEVLAVWRQPFGCFFTSAVWRHVLVLVAGVVLAPGRRTVTAALRVMGLDQEAGFAVYHRGL